MQNVKIRSKNGILFGTEIEVDGVLLGEVSSLELKINPDDANRLTVLRHCVPEVDIQANVSIVNACIRCGRPLSDPIATSAEPSAVDPGATGHG